MNNRAFLSISMDRLMRILLIASTLILPFNLTINQLVGVPLITFWKLIVVFLLLYFTFLKFALYGTKRLVLSGRTNFLILVFVLYVTVLAMFNFCTRSIYGLAGYLLYVIFYFCFLIYIRKEHILLIARLLVFLGVILSIGAILQILIDPSLFGLVPRPMFIPQQRLLVVRTGSFMGAPTTFGLYINFIFFIALGLFISERDRKKRFFYASVICAMLISIVTTLARRVWLHFILSCLSFIILVLLSGCEPKKRYLLRRLLNCVLVGLVALGMLIYLGRLTGVNSVDIAKKRFMSTFDFRQDRSNLERLARWKATTAFILGNDSFLFGNGPGQACRFGTHDTVQDSELLNYLDSFTEGRSGPESWHLALVVDLGIVGALLFLCIYFRLILIGFHTVINLLKKDTKTASVILGITSGFIGFVPVAALDEWCLANMFWLCAGIVMVTAKAERQGRE